METKEIKTMEDKIQELDSKHNSDIPLHIRNLWASIINYADAANELGAEGNSGEFHNSEEEKRLVKEWENSLDKLIIEFSKNTGYVPVYLEIKEYFYFKNNNGAYIHGIWTYKKNEDAQNSVKNEIIEATNKFTGGQQLHTESFIDELIKIFNKHK